MILEFTATAKDDEEAKKIWQALFWEVYDPEFLRRYGIRVVAEDEVGSSEAKEHAHRLRSTTLDASPKATCRVDLL
ncbi:MAG: hypothetical protein HY619_05065 [Thaumarchaeota archaeon]|nr:hypothetical protein [Nitrososphaerota archaeon]